MREKILSSDSVSKYICDHQNVQLFDEYLAEYQQDIAKIIGKHRHANHALSHDEIVSEANLLLIKGKNKILEKLGKDFSHANFKKMAFAYVRNAINWSHYSENNSKEAKNLLDSVHESEDGPMTTYELALETQGVEDDLDILKNTDSLKQFIHVLTHYSYLLSESEVKIISYMQKGLKQEQISEKLGVTHQAISFAVVKLKEKLQSQFNLTDILNQKAPKGKEAIANFFSAGKQSKILEKDKERINKFLHSSPPKSYTVRQLNHILFKSKYSNRQISSYLNHQKLYNLISR